MNKHKHHDLIVAWAAGARIQHLSSTADKWYYEAHPAWGAPGACFRLEPEAEYPKTTLSDRWFREHWHNPNRATVDLSAHLREIANAAIKHAVLNGQVGVVT